jgi:hypothetical protein
VASYLTNIFLPLLFHFLFFVLNLFFFLLIYQTKA